MVHYVASMGESGTLIDVEASTKTVAARRAVYEFGIRVSSHRVWVTGQDEIIVETTYGSQAVGLLVLAE